MTNIIGRIEDLTKEQRKALRIRARMQPECRYRGIHGKRDAGRDACLDPRRNVVTSRDGPADRGRHDDAGAAQ